MNGTAMYAYVYPNDSRSRGSESKKAGGEMRPGLQRCRAKFEKHKAKLREYMQTLETERLRYWSGVIMLDPRFCGATGQGGFWAAASDQVNQIAKDILRDRDMRVSDGGGCSIQRADGEPLKASKI